MHTTHKNQFLQQNHPTTNKNSPNKTTKCGKKKQNQLKQTINNKIETQQKKKQNIFKSSWKKNKASAQPNFFPKKRIQHTEINCSSKIMQTTRRNLQIKPKNCEKKNKISSELTKLKRYRIRETNHFQISSKKSKKKIFSNSYSE